MRYAPSSYAFVVTVIGIACVFAFLFLLVVCANTYGCDLLPTNVIA